MVEEAKFCLRMMFLLILMFICLCLLGNNLSKQDKAKNTYEVQYFDDGKVTYKIIKDKLGDVVFCEPVGDKCGN